MEMSSVFCILCPEDKNIPLGVQALMVLKLEAGREGFVASGPAPERAWWLGEGVTLSVVLCKCAAPWMSGLVQG